MGVIARMLVAAAIGCTVTGIVHGAVEVRLRGKVVSENQSPIRGASIVLLNGIDRQEVTAGPGGEFLCNLLIEKDGEDYQQVPYGRLGETRPVLPVFKLADIPSSLAGKMKINRNEATLKGPVYGAVR